jgi:excisionase family DNA binding protein
MAQKYYNSADAAKVLGVSADEVKKMLDRRELYGYRDGADWKFKIEDIDRMAEQRRSEGQPESPEAESGDVLLSEVALGQSDAGTSGTVIAMEGLSALTAASDIQLAGSDVKMGTGSGSGAGRAKELGGSVTQFENLNLALERGGDEATAGTASKFPPSLEASALSGSAIDLGGKALEDDDLVLGGSGPGSDVSIGGDSGISLLDPADSGLSLDQPVDLAGGTSLDLTQGSTRAASASAPADSDFLLTPLEEPSDLEGSESGSQVIALDTEDDEDATIIGEATGASVAAMLEEDFGGQPALDVGMGAPLATASGLASRAAVLGEGAPVMQSSAPQFEAPYTGWQIFSLSACALVLMFCGMMTYDLLRNMWSWEGPYTINSALMDAVLRLF